MASSVIFELGSDSTPGFKLLMLGDAGVGKTSFIRRHLTGEFEERYVPTYGCRVLPLTFYTTRGAITFNVYDLGATDAKALDSMDNEITDIQCAILMFDVTSQMTYKNVQKWHHDVTRLYGDVPIVLCGNKVDLEGEKVKLNEQEKLQFYEISVRSNYQFEKPFLYLSRRLSDDPELQFVSLCAGCGPPPEINLDPGRIERLQNEIKNLPDLPDDNDEL